MACARLGTAAAGHPGPGVTDRVEQLVERLVETGREHVGVRNQVAVGGDAVEDRAVVRRHADRQGLARSSGGTA